MQVGYPNAGIVKPAAHPAELSCNRPIAGPCDLDAPHQR
jgi:hypothetical protein